MTEKYLQFRSASSVTDRVFTDAWEYKPKAPFKAQKQKLWGWFSKRYLLPYSELTHTVSLTVVDREASLRFLLSQLDQVEYLHGHRPARIIIGSQDFRGFASGGDVAPYIRYTEKGVRFLGAVFDLEIEIVPWMRGMVVLP